MGLSIQAKTQTLVLILAHPSLINFQSDFTLALEAKWGLPVELTEMRFSKEPCKPKQGPLVVLCVDRDGHVSIGKNDRFFLTTGLREFKKIETQIKGLEI